MTYEEQRGSFQKYVFADEGLENFEQHERGDPDLFINFDYTIRNNNFQAGRKKNNSKAKGCMDKLNQ